MHSNSRPVQSPQTTACPGLPRSLQRQAGERYRKPLQAHNRISFERLQEFLAPVNQPLILDAGCGNGDSSLALARENPGMQVIGVDKSRHRLRRHLSGGPVQKVDNCFLVRADLRDFWRLAAAAGWHLHRHFLLYPNPWPRPARIKRRWHAHPVFRYALALGGFMEMRTNWPVYAYEFANTLRWLGFQPDIQEGTGLAPLSPFEKKYAGSGHRLYRCAVDLEPHPCTNHQLVTGNQLTG